MNTKSAAPILKPLDLPHRTIPIVWSRRAAPITCRITQPGYYLIGLRMQMQHIQKQKRPASRHP